MSTGEKLLGAMLGIIPTMLVAGMFWIIGNTNDVPVMRDGVERNTATLKTVAEDIAAMRSAVVGATVRIQSMERDIDNLEEQVRELNRRGK